MDIMMPVMNGYETMRGDPPPSVAGRPPDHRRHRQGRSTASAQRCLEAGASDYIPKPVRLGGAAWRACAGWFPASTADRGGADLTRRRRPPIRPPRSSSSTTTRPSGSRSWRCSSRSATRSSRPTRARPRCAPSCARTFAVILMDVRMPTLDGYETAGADPAARRVRAHADHLHHRVRTRRDRDPRPRTPAAPSTSSSRRSSPDILRAKVSIFVDLFLQSRELRSSLESITALNAALRDSEVRARAVLAERRGRDRDGRRATA